jgi:hypothetical protein
MSVDANDIIDAIGSTAAHAPPALLAALFLITPTTIWVLYRLMFGRTRQRTASLTGYLWVCQMCHSANQPADKTCYGCGNPVDRFETIQLIDSATGKVIEAIPGYGPERSPDQVPAMTTVSEAIPVGPGRRPETVIELGPSQEAVPQATVGSSAPGHTPPERSMAALGARRPHDVEGTRPE